MSKFKEYLEVAKIDDDEYDAVDSILDDHPSPEEFAEEAWSHGVSRNLIDTILRKQYHLDDDTIDEILYEICQ